MQREATEQWTEFCKQCINKPLTEFTELNIKTFNNFNKNSNYIDKFIHAKKWEDVMAAQIDFATLANSEGINYAQQAFNIWMDTSANVAKLFTGSFHRAANKAESL